MKCIKCGQQGCKPYIIDRKVGEGFSIGRALIGTALFGTVGTAIGFTKAENVNASAKWFCPKCRYIFSERD